MIILGQNKNNLKYGQIPKNMISDKKAGWGGNLENNDHAPVGRIRTNHPAVASFTNYDLPLFFFRKYIRGLRSPQTGTTYMKAVLMVYTQKLPLARVPPLETIQATSFYAKPKSASTLSAI